MPSETTGARLSCAMPTAVRENAMAGRSPISPAVSKSSSAGDESKLPSAIDGLLQSSRSCGPRFGLEAAFASSFHAPQSSPEKPASQPFVGGATAEVMNAQESDTCRRHARPARRAPVRPESPNSDSDSQLAAAAAKIGAGDFAGATAILEKVVAADPGNKLAWRQLGFAYLKQKKIAESRAAYEKLLAISPRRARRPSTTSASATRSRARPTPRSNGWARRRRPGSST